MTEKEKPADVWLHSTDEERWSSNEEYATREEAIAGAIDYFGLCPDDVFFVGRKAAPAIHCNWGDDVIEQLQLNATDGIDDDFTEGWPDNTKEQEKELDDEIRRVIDAWLDRHNLRPRFFTVLDVSKHQAPGDA